MEEARLVLYASKKYFLNQLSKKCREYMMEKLCASNVCSVYKFAQSVIGEEDLMKRCLQVISQRTSEILKDANFLNVTPSMLEVILDQDSLAVSSEIEVVKGIMLWSEAECRRRDLVVNASNKRSVMEFALSKLRFLSLSSTEFVKNTDIYEILTPEENSAILSNLVQPNIRPIPSALCTNTKSRASKTKNCPKCGAAQNLDGIKFSESQLSFSSVPSTSQVSLGSQFSFGSLLLGLPPTQRQ